MSKKLFTLISTLVGCAGSAASAIIAYLNPAYDAAIIASIGIGTTAIIEILNLFTKD